MARVVMYSTRLCPYCLRARRLLRRLGAEFEQHHMSRRRADREMLAQLSDGGRTYPQVLVDQRPIGGFAELRDLHKRGKLSELLE